MINNVIDDSFLLRLVSQKYILKDPINILISSGSNQLF